MTDRPASLYRAFPVPEARRLLRKLEFHYTPKHASWLNRVEIEMDNMNQPCLDKRISIWDNLKGELATWESRRNKVKTSINWLFDVHNSRVKLNRAVVCNGLTVLAPSIDQKYMVESSYFMN